MSRTVNAVCTGAEPRKYEAVNGWSFLFDSDEIEGGSVSKVFWMSPDMTAKAKASWTKVLTHMGFDPVGKSADEWSRIGSFVKGAKVVLVMEQDAKGREKVKYINVPGGEGGDADLTETCNTAATLFGGAQAKLPLEVPATQDDSEVPF